MATQSLYRRYRPRRFSELKGQDHIVRALRDAVRAGREGQAYLFSGPRGTGKTTTARILAKVLNCTDPVDGEPCCACESCLAVEAGNSYDVFELDAASNNSVDDVRSLIDKVSLGTPGRHKVYILDEVHMLGPGASAALLKVLEEPPSHVVFVLATTDPQRLKDTIRSRTQHLQFHLLPSDTLADHVRWVADDAGIELDEDMLDAALDRGGGSARDTLSALELLASTGGEDSERIDLAEFTTAVANRDAGQALAAVAHAVNAGHDPRTLCEHLLRHLRDLFLSLMAPELVQARADRIDELATTAREMGAADVVRTMERLGTALVEMRFAPDPRIMLEVALVQLTHDATGDDTSALASRLDRLEKAVAAGATAAAAPAPAPAPRDPATGRAVVGGRARRGDASGSIPRPNAEAAAPADAPAPAAAPEPAPAADTPAPAADAPAAAPTAAAPVGPIDAHRFAEIWDDAVKPALRPIVRALYSPCDVASISTDGGAATLVMSAPTPAHAEKCTQHIEAVTAAVSAALGMPAAVSITGAAAPPAPSASGGSTAGAAAAATAIEEEVIDPDELTNAPSAPAASPEDAVADIFPNTRIVTTDE
ncbi:MAG: DNA polymerase III subunit gamma/tau [Actinobacteria bacterium]|nr:DNA polymerase III subunit gamma/tau [Actinomycetota bacterium]